MRAEREGRRGIYRSLSVCPWHCPTLSPIPQFYLLQIITGGERSSNLSELKGGIELSFNVLRQRYSFFLGGEESRGDTEDKKMISRGWYFVPLGEIRKGWVANLRIWNFRIDSIRLHLFARRYSHDFSLWETLTSNIERYKKFFGRPSSSFFWGGSRNNGPCPQRRRNATSRVRVSRDI